MSGVDKDAQLCARVFDRLVDGGDAGVGADRILADHLGSCVTCFRTMSELRDAPRVAEALRAMAAASPAPAPPAPSDRFWEDLAVRTTDAAAAALGGLGREAGRVGREAVGGRGRWSVPARARVAVVATVFAAAAALVLVARRPPAVLPSGEPAVRAPGAVASVSRSAADDESGEAAADVADLDGTALRRLLDRLRTRAPAVLTGSGASDPEASDVLGDDDRHVNDELADLDGTALRRVASSLSGSPL